LKFQANAEKTAINIRGLLFLPHPVRIYGVGLAKAGLIVWQRVS